MDAEDEGVVDFKQMRMAAASVMYYMAAYWLRHPREPQEVLILYVIVCINVHGSILLVVLHLLKPDAKAIALAANRAIMMATSWFMFRPLLFEVGKVLDCSETNSQDRSLPIVCVECDTLRDAMCQASSWFLWLNSIPAHAAADTVPVGLVWAGGWTVRLMNGMLVCSTLNLLLLASIWSGKEWT